MRVDFMGFHFQNINPIDILFRFGLRGNRLSVMTNNIFTTYL